MKIFEILKKRATERQAEKYKLALLTCQLRLSDVPEWLLQDPSHCSALYRTAFRVDRGMGEEQYRKDLKFLDMEILFAEIRGEDILVEILTQVLDTATLGLELFKKPE